MLQDQQPGDRQATSGQACCSPTMPEPPALYRCNGVQAPAKNPTFETEPSHQAPQTDMFHLGVGMGVIAHARCHVKKAGAQQNHAPPDRLCSCVAHRFYIAVDDAHSVETPQGHQDLFD